MLDNIGFRTTHTAHREWLSSIECLKYRITDPESTNPYFYGFAQNYLVMAEQPWREIVFMDVDYEHLLDRVTKYRISAKIKDGESHVKVARSLFDLANKMQAELSAGTSWKLTIVDGNHEPDAIVRTVKAHFNNVSGEKKTNRLR